MYTINDIKRAAYKYAKAKGFYDDEPNPDPIKKLMLVVEELGEACSAIRSNRRCESIETLALCDFNNDDDIIKESDSIPNEAFIAFFEDQIKDTFEDEIADAIIRLLEMSGNMNIDIEAHIIAKMAYNNTRPYKHNKIC